MKKTRQFLTILLAGLVLTAFGAVVPKNTQTLELQQGWNLIALAGEPLRPQELLSHQVLVFDNASQSYIQYTAGMKLERGQSVWLYSTENQPMELALVSTEVVPPETQPDGNAWDMIGAATDTPSWLENVIQPFFRWDAQQGFAPTNEAVKGQGYWVQVK